MTDEQANKGDEKAKPGPDPDRLNLEGDWEELVGDALRKKRPPEGWPPKPEKGEGQEES
jgi:hypothetical protein